MKRRDILRAGASSLALAGMTAAAPQAAASANFAWSRASALALVGQAFFLNHPELRAIGLTLAEVQTPQHADPRLQQFSLLFASDGAQFGAGTYELEHASLGRFNLYLAPAGKGAGAARYRADFSLLA
jgi:hypothetical protein